MSIERPFSPSRLAALNFGIQCVWGAILAVSLPARCVELSGQNSEAAFGALAAGGAAVAAIVQLVAGRLADLRAEAVGDRRDFYIGGIALAMPMLLWFYLAPTYAALCCAFFGLQIAMNTMSGPYQAVIPDHAPVDRQSVTASWMSAFQSLGAAVGLVVAGFVNNATLVALFLIAALGTSFGVTYTGVRGRTIEAPPAARVLFGPPLLILFLSRGLINTGFYILLDFLLFFIRDALHISDAQTQRTDTAIVFLSFTIAAVVGAFFAAQPVARFDRRQVITAANAVIFAALIGLAFSTALPGMIAAAVIAGVAWGIFVTADWALACALLPRQAMATAMGIWNLATVLPQVLAPLVVTPLIVFVNSTWAGLGPRAAMVVAAVIFALGTAVIWRLPAQKQAQQAA